uniref:Uncharacterized protein TCIL3000_11_13810 n=1 Tax=Trypanosoma congolense (strain IL3000) TaxID=1068625 RepID=G0V2K3_TRYCI|nr:unnamed protein product [Trypanosoma congolense IL3000]
MTSTVLGEVGLVEKTPEHTQVEPSDGYATDAESTLFSTRRDKSVVVNAPDGSAGESIDHSRQSSHKPSTAKGAPAAASTKRRISWKCSLCSYYVLAMDHNGEPLVLGTSSFGEPLPMTCPRCLLSHCDWVQATPFDNFNNHVNIRSKQSNSYLTTTPDVDVEKVLPPISLSKGSQLPKTSIPPFSQGSVAPCKDPSIFLSMGREQPNLGRQMMYYCGKCDRKLLRMNQYGELIPMACDKDGATLPVLCPGCKEEHRDWNVKLFGAWR